MLVGLLSFLRDSCVISNSSMTSINNGEASLIDVVLLKVKRLARIRFFISFTALLVNVIAKMRLKLRGEDSTIFKYALESA